MSGLRGWRGLRATALLGAGGIALHQLRYAVGYGASSEEALASHGHGYLSLVLVVVAVLAALAAGQLVALVARPGAPASAGCTGYLARPAMPLGHIWIAATLALLAVYGSQELVEGMLAHGHPTGAAALLAGGGAWALPLAAAIGLVIAVLERGAELAIAARSRSHRHAGARHGVRAKLPRRADLSPQGSLARHLASRAPPVHSV